MLIFSFVRVSGSTVILKYSFAICQSESLFGSFTPVSRDNLSKSISSSSSLLSSVSLEVPCSETSYKAAITRCDLSPRSFCIHAMLLCEFQSDKI